MVDVYLLAKLTGPPLCTWRYFSTPHGYIPIQVWSALVINVSQMWCFSDVSPTFSLDSKNYFMETSSSPPCFQIYTFNCKLVQNQNILNFLNTGMESCYIYCVLSEYMKVIILS